MAPTGTCRLYRPDPTRVGATEQWRWAQASATTTADSVVVTVTGEIDASNCAELAGYVERHVGVAGTLVLDLSAVAFFGTTALAALRRIDLCCDRIRWTLVPSPAVRRVLRACHAQDLPQATSVAAAVRRLGHLSENHVAELVAAQA
ncbi:MAG TPA: STAS domain-containing protein [Mycobacterium sp.]